MIGNMTKGSNPSGLLDYCYYEKENLSKNQKGKLSIADVRGEVIFVQNLALSTLADGRFDMEHLAKQMKETASKNRGLKDYVWHQSFSFSAADKPSKDTIIQITDLFAKRFGFEHNQLIVFQHNDTQHQHFHIVANRINSFGKTSAKDSFSHLRTGEFCRDIELQLGLKITPTMKALLPAKEREKFRSNSDIAESLRNKIDEELVKSKSLDEVSQSLKKQGIKMHINRGISFVDKKSGAKFKGSDLGRAYSLQNLEKRLGKDKLIKEVKPKVELKMSF